MPGTDRAKQIIKKRIEGEPMIVPSAEQIRQNVAVVQQFAEALRIVDFNERKQEFFCRACRYRDPLGPDGNKLHDDNCPWVDYVRAFKVLLDSLTLLDTLSQEAERLKEERDGWRFVHAKQFESALTALREEREQLNGQIPPRDIDGGPCACLCHQPVIQTACLHDDCVPRSVLKENATSESQGEPVAGGLMPLPDVAALQEQIALTEERDQARRAATELLEAVGIAKEHIRELTEEREGLKATCNMHAYDKCCLHDDLEEARQELAALTEVHERLRTQIGWLTEKWHQDAHRLGEDQAHHAALQCADELDALLSPREGTPQEPHE